MNTSQPNTDAGQIMNDLQSGQNSSQSQVVFEQGAAQADKPRHQVGNYAIDPAHNNGLRGPHLRAEKFRSYTNWLEDIHQTADIPTPLNTEDIVESKAVGPREIQPVSTFAEQVEPAASTSDIRKPALITKITPVMNRVIQKNEFTAVKPTSDLIPTDGFDPDGSTRQLTSIKHQAESLTVRLRQTSNFSSGIQSLRPATAGWETESLQFPNELNQLMKLSASAFGELATAASKLLSPANTRLVFSGATRQHGTTTIMVSVARTLAARGKRVLMIDADIEKPDLSNRLNLNKMISWIDSVKVKRKPSNYIVRGIRSNLHVMPLAQVSQRIAWPNFMLDSLGEIVNKIRHRFDVILIDVGPGSQLFKELSASDILVDAAVLVNNVHQSPTGNFERFRHNISDFGIKRVVVADNFISAKPSASTLRKPKFLAKKPTTR